MAELGAFPAGNGDPGTAVNAPVVWSTVKTETLLATDVLVLSLVTNTNRPDGSRAGELGDYVRAPVVGSML